jgi:hypothetical protein
MTAKMIPVVTVTDATLDSSSITENDFPVYNPATTYAASTEAAPVKVIYLHVIWESVQGSNTGNTPSVANVAFWTKLLATNKWSVFDGYVQNQSTRAESAQWVVTPGAIVSSVSLFNMNAASVTITVTEPTAGVVYNRTISLVDNSGVFDAYSYFFSPVVTKKNFCVTDLPPYANAAISVTVNNPGGTAAIGQITFGHPEIFGETLNLMPLGLKDYTLLNEDGFGRTFPTVRGYSRKTSPAISVDSYRVTYLEGRIAELRGVPTVWAFDTVNGDNELVYLGFFTDMNFLYSHSEKTILDLEIRSLV